MNPTEQQFLKLRELLAYVSIHSTFYKSLFNKNKIELGNEFSFSDFQKIPFTTKEDLQENNSDFICVPRSKLIDHVATSGTTGKAVTLALSDKDLDRLALNEMRSFQTAGIGSDDLIQLMTTIDKRFMAGLAYFLGARKLGAGIIRVGNGLPELQWENILELKPSVIICVPSFILRLIEYAEKNKIDFKNSSIKKAICIGEAIRNEDFTLNALGTKITKLWDIDLYSTYASSEMATAFTECEAKKGVHLQEDLLVVEIIGDDGQPVKTGEAGELVISTLGIEAMPLIRFKTGDICIAHHTNCSCGRTSLRLSPVLGRKNQRIKYKGTSLYPTAIFEILENSDGISNYQIEAYTNDIATDELNVFFSIKESIDYKEIEMQLINMFKTKLRVVPQLQLKTEEELIRLIYPANNRKPLKFIDKR